ncbi:hypothetical protein CYMTET_19399 [Cymbomonas tetramitiformis]|uniref:ABC transporter domain-containing protein n=1 Tax=Cymbomonas tetramitiformis TaxID=36881 RepID=A0AAE0G696_9CHLO|nr:hypothetical protein CYMTET_19399 [Cymbomonas tetramitiformis]
MTTGEQTSAEMIKLEEPEVEPDSIVSVSPAVSSTEAPSASAKEERKVHSHVSVSGDSESASCERSGVASATMGDRATHDQLENLLREIPISDEVRNALRNLFHLAEDNGNSAKAFAELAQVSSKLRAIRSHSKSNLKEKMEQINILTERLNQFMLGLQSMYKSTNRVAQRQMVKFRNVNYSASLFVSEEAYETVGSKAMKPLVKLRNLLQGKKPPITEKVLVGDLTGYLTPGTMTLVIGPPGCGKSSVHKVLSGRGNALAGKTLTGEVLYNGRNILGTDNRIEGEDYIPKRVAAYIQQTDQHFSTLTVSETAQFAYDCSHIPLDACEDDLLRKNAGLPDSDLPAFAQVVLELLGLTKVKDTQIGDEKLRGVSGGERHRVTTMEFLVGAYLIFFCDEISTGLDASATFDIVSTLKIYSEVFKIPMLFSLLQPAPEVLDLFDNIIVLEQGKPIYQGPREDILGYFDALGYAKPDRVDTADFLQELTSDLGSQYLKVSENL